MNHASRLTKVWDRLIVELTFGRLDRFPLLAKDNAARISSSKTEIRLAIIHFKARRLASTAQLADEQELPPVARFSDPHLDLAKLR